MRRRHILGPLALSAMLFFVGCSLRPSSLEQKPISLVPDDGCYENPTWERGGDLIYKGVVHHWREEFRRDAVAKAHFRRVSGKDVVFPRRAGARFHTAAGVLVLPGGQATGQDIEEDNGPLFPEYIQPINRRPSFDSDTYDLFAPLADIVDPDDSGSDEEAHQRSWVRFSPVTEWLDGRLYVKVADGFRKGEPYVNVDKSELVFHKGEGRTPLYTKPSDPERAVYILAQREINVARTMKYVPKEDRLPHRPPRRKTGTLSYKSREAGLSLRYPAEWQVCEVREHDPDVRRPAGASIFLFGPKNVSRNYYPTIAIYRITWGAPLKLYRDFDEILASMEVKVLSKRRRRVDGAAATDVRVEGSELWSPFWFDSSTDTRVAVSRYVVSRRPKELLILAYHAHKEDFDTYTPAFEAVLATLAHSE